MDEALVLVTGASGYIAKHCILQLLEAGYRVRGTLRNMAFEPHLQALFANLTDASEKLELVSADLTSDDGWDAAMVGCMGVLHLASPFPGVETGDENDLIRPAREGTIRVIQAAAKAGIPRVVQTSSIASMMYAAESLNGLTLTESTWSRLDHPRITGYAKSKTVAEETAWEVAHDTGIELATIQPGLTFGPLLDERFGTSVMVVRNLMQRAYPGVSRTGYLTVDVRDVAATHIAALTTPEAAGRRFLCVENFHWLKEIAVTLKGQFAERGYAPSTILFPDWGVRLLGRFNDEIQTQVPMLGVMYHADIRPAQKLLGFHPHSLAESLQDTGDSLIEQGVLT